MHRRFHCCLLIGLLTLFAPDAVLGVEPTPIVVDVKAEQLRETLPQGGEKFFRSIDVEPGAGPNGTDAVRFRTTAALNNVWQQPMTFPVDATLKRGDTIHATFWLRGVRDGESGDQRPPSLTVRLHPKQGPHNRVCEASVVATPEWKLIQLPMTTRRDFNSPADETRWSFCFGYGRQTIEIADPRLVTYGREISAWRLPSLDVHYPGEEDGAAWREEALERIDRIRRSDLTVKVVDAEGRPVPDADVSVEMTKRGYPLGCTLPTRLFQTDKDYRDRELAIYARLFNRGVAPSMTWSAWASPQGNKVQWEALRWMKANGFDDIHATHAVWGAWKRVPGRVQQRYEALKEEAPEKAAAYLREELNAHLTKKLTDTRDYFSLWNVVNEPRNVKDLSTALGEREIVEWFKLAERVAPDAKRLINEYAIMYPVGNPEQEEKQMAEYERLVRFLLDEGAPIDAVGVQCHYKYWLQSPEETLARFDRLAKLGLPIEVTEFDVNIANPETNARFVRDFMIAAYSHPAVSGITLWGFAERTHWLPNAAMWDRDLHPKPAGEIFEELWFDRWWTRANERTDAEGACSIPAYHGEHRVVVTVDGQRREATIDVRPGGADVEIQLDGKDNQ